MSKSLITPVTTSVTKENFEESLTQWAPQSKKDSIRMLHFVSLITKHSKGLKEACFNYLQNNSSTKQNAIDPESGLEVILVEPKIKVYRKSKKTEAIENKIEKLSAQITELKAKLKE